MNGHSKEEVPAPDVTSADDNVSQVSTGTSERRKVRKDNSAYTLV